jgi:hypothetical protein
MLRETSNWHKILWLQSVLDDDLKELSKELYHLIIRRAACKVSTCINDCCNN